MVVSTRVPALLGWLDERGYLANISDPALLAELLSTGSPVYEGFDPTADALHLGHFLSLMVLRALQQAGVEILFLLGGGTARIGDPTGRSAARRQMTKNDIAANAESIKTLLERLDLLYFGEAAQVEKPARMVNNADWLEDMPLFDYLEEVAAYSSVNNLVKVRTFATRLESGEHLSLLEMIYPSLQAYDFRYLRDHYGCRIQIGGEDQWSNMLAGIRFIERTRSETAAVVTLPLLTDASGGKMGKTSGGGTIWLDERKTSPFEFFQYWLRTADADLRRRFLLFTPLPSEEINRVLAGHPRDAQHRLAYEVTALVHGAERATRAQDDAFAAFGGRGTALDVPTMSLSLDSVGQLPTVVDILVVGGIVSSQGRARRLIQQGAVRLNNTKVDDVDRRMTLADCRQEGDELAVLLRYGKGKVMRVLVKDSPS